MNINSFLPFVLAPVIVIARAFSVRGACQDARIDRRRKKGGEKGRKAQERSQGNDKSEEGEAHRDGTLKGNAYIKW